MRKILDVAHTFQRSRVVAKYPLQGCFENWINLEIYIPRSPTLRMLCTQMQFISSRNANNTMINSMQALLFYWKQHATRMSANLHETSHYHILLWTLLQMGGCRHDLREKGLVFWVGLCLQTTSEEVALCLATVWRGKVVNQLSLYAESS